MLTPQQIQEARKKYNLPDAGTTTPASSSGSYSQSLTQANDLVMSDVNRPSTKLSGGTFTLADTIKNAFTSGIKGIGNKAAELGRDFIDDPLSTIASIGKGAIDQTGHWLNESGKMVGKGIDAFTSGKTTAYDNYMNNFGRAADEVLQPDFKSPQMKRAEAKYPSLAFNNSPVANDIGGGVANTGLAIATGGVADKAVKGWQAASTLGKVAKFSTRLGLDATIQGAEGAIIAPEGEKGAAFLGNAIAGPALEGTLWLGGKALKTAVDRTKYFKDWSEFGRDMAKQNLVDKQVMRKIANDPAYLTQQVDKYTKNFTDEITTRANTLRLESQSGKDIQGILTEHPALVMGTRIENKGGALRWNTEQPVQYINEINKELSAVKQELFGRMPGEGIPVSQLKGRVKQYIKQNQQFYGGNVDDAVAKMMAYINRFDKERGGKGFLTLKDLDQIRQLSSEAAYAGSAVTTKAVMTQPENAVYTMARDILDKSPGGATLKKLYDTQSDLLFMKKVLGPNGAGIAGKPAAGGLFANGIDKLIGSMAGNAVGGFPGTFIGAHIGGQIGELLREAHLPITMKTNIIKSIMRYQYGADWEKKAIGDVGKQMIRDLEEHAVNKSAKAAKEAIMNRTTAPFGKPASEAKHKWYQTPSVSSMDNSVATPEIPLGEAPNVAVNDNSLSMDSLIPAAPDRIIPPQPSSSLNPKVTSRDSIKKKSNKGPVVTSK